MTVASGVQKRPGRLFHGVRDGLYLRGGLKQIGGLSAGLSWTSLLAISIWVWVQSISDSLKARGAFFVA